MAEELEEAGVCFQEGLVFLNIERLRQCRTASWQG